MSATNIRNNVREMYKSYNYYNHYSKHDPNKITTNDKENWASSVNNMKSFTQEERKLFIKIIKNPNSPKLYTELTQIALLDKKILEMKGKKNLTKRKTNLLKKISRSAKNLVGLRTSTSEIFHVLKKDHKKLHRL